MNRTHEPRRGVFFNQGCPVCGRRLEIDVGLLGAPVYCQHCGGRFVAMDAALGAQGRDLASDRADELLARAATLLAEFEDAR